MGPNVPVDPTLTYPQPVGVAKRAISLGRAVVIHPYAWLWEPLEIDPTFVLRSMFGARAAYLGGRLMLCFCAGEEPWRGVLVCTSREHHPALRSDFPALTPHAILPKWLYLPESSDAFESSAARLVRLARMRDPRLGVLPAERRARSLRADRRSMGRK